MSIEIMGEKRIKTSWISSVFGVVALRLVFLTACVGDEESQESETSVAVIGDGAQVIASQGGNSVVDPNALSIGAVEITLTTNAAGGTYPRPTRLANGTVLSAFVRSSGGTSSVVVSRSTDNGVSFGDFGMVASSPNVLGDPALLELPIESGQTNPVILCAFRNDDVDSSGNYTYFRLTLCVSQDGGATWSFRSQAVEKTAPNGLYHPFMRLGRSGEVQLYYALENSSTDEDLLRRTSTDKGVSWSSPITVAGGSTTARTRVPSVAATVLNQNNALVMAFETNRDGPSIVASLTSYDDGATWLNRSVIYQSPNNRNAGSPKLISSPSGSLAVVFITDEDNSASVAFTNSTSKIILGTPQASGAINWTTPVLVGDATSVWPSIVSLTLPHALVSYDRNGPKARQISFPQNF